MNCPYCNNEMKQGILCARGGSGMYWLPEGETIQYFVSNKKIEKLNGIIFIDCNAVGGLKYPTNVCSKCKKIIANF